jgi:hypothetical protein
MEQLEFPLRLHGTVEEQVRQLWEYLYRQAERRQAEQSLR